MWAFAAFAGLLAIAPVATLSAFSALAAALAFAGLIAIAALASGTITIAARTTPPWASLAARSLLLCALARGDSRCLAAGRSRPFEPFAAAATPPTPSRTIARRQSRQGELAAGSDRFDTEPARRLPYSGFIGVRVFMRIYVVR
ncbi:MAG TPA: hypothetical protein VGF92_11315 [Stellaceae bacterium]